MSGGEPVPGAHEGVQREVFDEVAGAYDRARPDYPPAVVDAVLAFAGLAPGERILEIGAGTGKATVAFAARGLALHCIEPGENLARVLRANVDAVPGAGPVEIQSAPFEKAHFERAGFGLVFAAQSFHWVDPEVAFVRCAEALRPGGALAIFGNRPRRGESEVHREVEACYLKQAPALRADALRSYRARDYAQEFRAAGAFDDPVEAEFAFHREYDAAGYCELLTTQSDHRMLAPEARQALLDDVAAAIDRHGGTIRVDYDTYLIQARRR